MLAVEKIGNVSEFVHMYGRWSCWDAANGQAVGFERDAQNIFSSYPWFYQIKIDKSDRGFCRNSYFGFQRDFSNTFPFRFFIERDSQTAR